MTAIPAVPSEPPLTEVELALLDDLESRANPAPWRHDDPDGDPDNRIIAANNEMVAGNYDYEVGGIIDADDTEFIIVLRNLFPRLVASLRSAREEITALRGWINDTDAALEAALGDRWSPDRPPAKGVKQLAEERDQAKELAEAWEAYGKALNEQCAFYRGGKHPSDASFRRLDKARATIARLTPAEEGASRGE